MTWRRGTTSSSEGDGRAGQPSQRAGCPRGGDRPGRRPPDLVSDDDHRGCDSRDVTAGPRAPGQAERSGRGVSAVDQVPQSGTGAVHHHRRARAPALSPARRRRALRRTLTTGIREPPPATSAAAGPTTRRPRRPPRRRLAPRAVLSKPPDRRTERLRMTPSTGDFVYGSDATRSPRPPPSQYAAQQRVCAANMHFLGAAQPQMSRLWLAHALGSSR